jgi:methionine salvage enolase-phosphatase E1
MDKNILDDNSEWENEGQSDNSLFYINDEAEVVMIRAFNTEEQAYLYAASLKDNDIDAHVVGSATSQMTPFAFGNHRLYVAEAQALKAQQILIEMDARNQVFDLPSLSATRILIIIIIGLLIMSIAIAAIQAIFKGFKF